MELFNKSRGSLWANVNWQPLYVNYKRFWMILASKLCDKLILLTAVSMSLVIQVQSFKSNSDERKFKCELPDELELEWNDRMYDGRQTKCSYVCSFYNMSRTLYVHFYDLKT